jgi:hypothetical protein
MKLDALEHPKTLHLASLLGVTRPTVLGHLELLWAFTGKHSPQGDIGKWPDGAIARACDWMGDPQVFLQSLLQSGFVDADAAHRYIIHDWPEHAARWVRAKLAKAGLQFITVVATVVRSADDASDDDDGPLPDDGGTVDPTTVATVEASSKSNVAKRNEETPTAAKKPPRAKHSRDPDPEWLADFKREYPDRLGGQEWRKAIRAANSRIAEGHSPAEFIAGAKRYHAHCKALEKIGTEFVKQAATFLGPDKHFLEPWPAKPKANNTNHGHVFA